MNKIKFNIKSINNPSTESIETLHKVVINIMTSKKQTN